MAQGRPAKRRRTTMEQTVQLEERQLPNILGTNVNSAAPNIGNSYVAPQAVGDVPSDFTFPALQFTQTSVAQQKTFIPVVTTFIATSTAYVQAVAPAPIPTRPAVPVQGVPTMATQFRQGTTTVEAQQGQPSIGMLAPKQDATAKMDQWTARVLIIAGSIAGALILLFLVLIIHRWRQGKKPFSRLFSWSKATDEEEDEDDLRPYSTTIPQFDPVDPRFSTYQKPIWDVNSSMSSLPQKPNMAYNSSNSTSRDASPFHKRAMPSQSRFPPPNKIKNLLPLAEPRSFFRNQFNDAKNDTKVHVANGKFDPSDSSVDYSVDGLRTDDTQSYQEQVNRPLINTKKKAHEKDSKFSWTNSHGPSPRSPPQRPSRQSLDTSGTSVVAYLEVDGWVGNQTNRLVEFQIQQLFDDALEGHDRAGSPGVSPKTPAPIAEAVMPLYIPESYKELAMTKMIDSSTANNAVTNPSARSRPQAAEPKGVAATSLYENLARGRYQ